MSQNDKLRELLPYSGSAKAPKKGELAAFGEYLDSMDLPDIEEAQPDEQRWNAITERLRMECQQIIQKNIKPMVNLPKQAMVKPAIKKPGKVG